MDKTNKKVIVGMSGGVDSSVSAYLLKLQGYEVIGLFMQNWQNEPGEVCTSEIDFKDASDVCDRLDIPLHRANFSNDYWNNVFEEFLNEHKAGRTPNPDVLCNREIKFDVFMDIALDLGADFVATGHYCRKEEEIIDDKPIYKLLAGKDINKDQSYFLCQLSQHQLSKALFPIGELTKPEVREIAKNADLITAAKKDSQGLCFIGKVRLPEFLQQKLQSKEGEIVQVPNSAALYQREQPNFNSKEEELDFFATKYQYCVSENKS